MNGSSIPRLERPAFAHGQRLLPDDMRALFDFQRGVRWVHNYVLHDWGLGVGFTVDGRKGGREVTVAPGYALDCRGRDILLSEPVALQVPPVAGAAAGGPKTYLLTVSWLSDDELPVGETRRGVCEGGGAVRRPETPRVRWQDPVDLSDPAARFRPGLDLVLAAVEVEDCRLAADPDASLRRSARPDPGPHVVSGRTEAAATIWSFFPATGPRLGVETRVDTTAAGFRRTPAYFAAIEGSRVLAGATGGGRGTLLEGFTAVEDAAPNGFTLRLTLPRNLQTPQYDVNPGVAFQDDVPGRLRTQFQWRVGWVGMEA